MPFVTLIEYLLLQRETHHAKKMDYINIPPSNIT
jgi:hypothetical protein